MISSLPAGLVRVLDGRGRVSLSLEARPMALAPTFLVSSGSALESSLRKLQYCFSLVLVEEYCSRR
jgi:hypothetical protein